MNKLLLIALVCCCGCAGSLEGARAPRITSVMGVPTMVGPSERCVQLDDRYVVWGAGSITAESLAATAGLVSIPIEDKTGKVVLVTASVVMAATGAGMAFVSQSAATSWARECTTP